MSFSDVYDGFETRVRHGPQLSKAHNWDLQSIFLFYKKSCSGWKASSQNLDNPAYKLRSNFIIGTSIKLKNTGKNMYELKKIKLIIKKLRGI